jgi:hypothetical protein
MDFSSSLIKVDSVPMALDVVAFANMYVVALPDLMRELHRGTGSNSTCVAVGSEYVTD